MKREHSEQYLPRWAQQRLEALRQENARLQQELQRVEAAHAVLFHREWFTLPGPPPCDPPLAQRKLWFLNADQPIPACTLYHGDILLIGRTRKD